MGTVTRGGDTGRTITGRLSVAITPGGTLAGLRAEENGAPVSVSGALGQPDELRLFLDLGDGKMIAGTFAPFNGCGNEAARGKFTGPGGWNTNHFDGGAWSVVRASG